MNKFLCSLMVMAGLAFGADKPISDDALYDQVRIRLAGDLDVKGGALEITVKDGAVVLKGELDTEKKKDKATKITKKVHGVKSVDNEIKIVPR